MRPSRSESGQHPQHAVAFAGTPARGAGPRKQCSVPDRMPARWWTHAESQEMRTLAIIFKSSLAGRAVALAALLNVKSKRPWISSTAQGQDQPREAKLLPFPNDAFS